jgi:hypothetical protein
VELNLSKEQAALEKLSIGQLRERFAELFGATTHTANRVWLIRRILWRMQALAEGDLSERARQRAALLAQDADLRVVPPRDSIPRPSVKRVTASDTRGGTRLPPPGTTIVRSYKGRTLHVRVVTDGFEFEGKVYASLSAVAKAITGSHTNGYLFFKLGQYGDQP